MRDLIGRTLGHYRIVDKIGAGGMGEVYRAHDEQLERDVAIKVLPEEVAGVQDRLERFEREAKLLASLNHPNIATLHGLENEERHRFLVMELVEGESLASVIARGAIQLDEALPIALQIAVALEVAHEHGIIHRDLKPANVMVDSEGKVKVLDFGLAKAFDAEGSGPQSSESLAESPTLTADLTRDGVLLGTAAYMSPEQATGKPVDKRADIWAFGCVVFEILTGVRAFGGTTSTEVLSEIIKGEPAWDALPAETPAPVRRLLRRCLTKDPRDRVHDIADARMELNEVSREEAEQPADAEVSSRITGLRPRSWVLLVVGSLLSALLGVVATIWVTRGDNEMGRGLDARFSVDLAEGTVLHLINGPSIAISRDGRTLAWTAEDLDGERRLYVRGLDRDEPTLLRGTENACGPFFSPDGRWIAYFNRMKGQLEKTPVDIGLPQRICDAPTGSKGGTWGDRREIVFSHGFDGGLCRVSADGGPVEMLTEPDRVAGVKTHRFPQYLPGGRAVVFMEGDADIETYSESRIEVLDLDTGEHKLIVEGGMSPHYVSTGHLVFARQGALMAAPFDIDELELKDHPKRVLDGVVTNEGWGFGIYTIAQNGFLVYARGGPETYFTRFVQADSRGRSEPLALPERPYEGSFEFSPDGRQLAVTITGANNSVWLWEVERQVLSRLTSGWDNWIPTWSPDSVRLAFRSDRRTTGIADLVSMPIDRSRPATPLCETLQEPRPRSWSPDGRFIAFEDLDPETNSDIWVLPIVDNQQQSVPNRIIATPAREVLPRFSPDGRWLAYASDVTGTQEVYIQSFPGPGPQLQVSSGGGTEPVWAHRGDEIFYVNPSTRQMMRAPVLTTPYLRVGGPTALFPFESPFYRFDLSPDGEHFVFLQRGAQARPITQVQIVTNWFEELKRLVPTE